MSLETTTFDRLQMTLYSHSRVTLTLLFLQLWQ